MRKFGFDICGGSRLMNELGLREIQEASHEILKVISKICVDNNLRYYLFSGTLIGAVRHKGFIPWDDDLDIAMPRQDLDLLLEYFEKNVENQSSLRIMTPQNNFNYPYALPRVTDLRYEMKAENENSYGLGVFVDIYPLEGLGNDLEKAQDVCKKGNFLASCCYQSSRKKYSVGTTKGLRKSIKLPFYLFSKMLGTRYWLSRIEVLKNSCKDSFDNSKYVGCATWTTIGKKGVYPREWFDNSTLIPFEGGMYRVPTSYHDILTRIYGNYMELPPEEDRIAHHFYKIYRK